LFSPALLHLHPVSPAQAQSYADMRGKLESCLGSSLGFFEQWLGLGLGLGRSLGYL